MPIGALNQFSMDFRFKARILKKYPLKSYNSQKGQGVILNVDLIDREDTQIQATMFNETAQKWNAKLEEGKVYIFSNGKV